MAYYTALITAWNSSIQPPTGVTGTGLSSGDTTDQKLTKINAWTIVGTIPTTITVPSYQVASAVNYTEFKALNATQQNNLLNLLAATTNGFLGGSANISFLPVGMLLDYFGSSSVTIANLTAFARAQATPWWQVGSSNNGAGLTSPVNSADLIAAGGLT